MGVESQAQFPLGGAPHQSSNPFVSKALRLFICAKLGGAELDHCGENRAAHGNQGDLLLAEHKPFLRLT